MTDRVSPHGRARELDNLGSDVEARAGVFRQQADKLLAAVRRADW